MGMTCVNVEMSNLLTSLSNYLFAHFFCLFASCCSGGVASAFFHNPF